MSTPGAGSSHFNPRSREGSDEDEILDYAQATDFNPRSREGSDTRDGTHNAVPDDFNPRSREGSDMSDDFATLTVGQFQSTLP